MALNNSTLENQKSETKNRTGLFGGTFNPIHFGHIQAAREVLAGFGLDRIYMIPSAIPPHKKQRNISDARDRLEMCRLALEDCPDLKNKVIVSNIELEHPGISYTIDTVNRFNSILPEDTELFFILGLDAFLEIGTWKYYRKLFQAVRFIVMTRPGAVSVQELGEKALHEITEDYLHSVVSENYQFNALTNCHIHAEKQPVYIFKGNTPDISSTKIRELVRKGKTIQSLVPEKVKNYIVTKGLFNDK